MRYNLEGIDADTLKVVEKLREEIRELAERKSRVGRRKQFSLDRKIRVNKKRLEELTGQIDPDIRTIIVNPFDTPIPPTPQKSKQEAKRSNQWVQVFRGGAPGSGKRR